MRSGVNNKKPREACVASTLRRLVLQMRVKWECTANRGSRLLSRAPYTAETYTVACCHEPTSRHNQQDSQNFY